MVSGGAPVVFPCKYARPPYGFSAPAIELRNVVFPSPSVPIRPTISPSSTLTDTWFTAVRPPKFLTISCVSRIVNGSPPARGRPPSPIRGVRPEPYHPGIARSRGDANGFAIKSPSPLRRVDDLAHAIHVLPDREHVLALADDHVRNRFRRVLILVHHDPVRVGPLASPDVVLHELVDVLAGQLALLSIDFLRHFD